MVEGSRMSRGLVLGSGSGSGLGLGVGVGLGLGTELGGVKRVQARRGEGDVG